MPFINIEIKARTSKTGSIREYLLANEADFRGLDEQTDTYFNVPNGRLKLRQGKIENNLIFYNRPNHHGPKQSDFQLAKIEDGKMLNLLLTQALGIRIIVRKRREIYFIDNVKFHLDELDGLGTFVEIEAGNKDHDVDISRLHEQCNFYMREFGIEEKDLVNVSYSDMLEEQTGL